MIAHGAAVVQQFEQLYQHTNSVFLLRTPGDAAVRYARKMQR